MMRNLTNSYLDTWSIFCTRSPFSGAARTAIKSRNEPRQETRRQRTTRGKICVTWWIQVKTCCLMCASLWSPQLTQDRNLKAKTQCRTLLLTTSQCTTTSTVTWYTNSLRWTLYWLTNSTAMTAWSRVLGWLNCLTKQRRATWETRAGSSTSKCLRWKSTSVQMTASANQIFKRYPQKTRWTEFQLPMVVWMLLMHNWSMEVPIRFTTSPIGLR